MTSILDGRITTSKTGTKRLGAVGASLACAILVFGCLSGCNRGAVYQASKLPIGMAATPIHSAEQVNLSALARSAMVSEMVYPGDILEVRITTGLETDEKPAELVRVDEQGVATNEERAWHAHRIDWSRRRVELAHHRDKTGLAITVVLVDTEDDILIRSRFDNALVGRLTI